MKRPIFILGGLLAVQLGVAAALSMNGSNHAAFKAQEPLLAFDPGKIGRIEIDENGTDPVELAKKDGIWTVASMSGFPANEEEVQDLLRKLTALKKGWPVATSSEARQRFKVTDAAHERRIILKEADKTAGEVLLGSSPSFRQTHASTGNDDKVYSVAFGIYDASARAPDWMNRDYLKTPEDQIASISVGGITLERKDKKFVLSGLQDGEKPLDSEIAKLALAASSPSFDSVEGKGEQALAKVSQPDVLVTVKRNDGTVVSYSYKKEAGGLGYLFASSGHDFVFKIGEVAAAPIVSGKREALIEAKKPAAEAQKPAGEPDKAEAQADKPTIEASKPEMAAQKPGEEPKKAEAQVEKPGTDEKKPDAPAATEEATKHGEPAGSGG